MSFSGYISSHEHPDIKWRTYNTNARNPFYAHGSVDEHFKHKRHTPLLFIQISFFYSNTINSDFNLIYLLSERKMKQLHICFIFIFIVLIWNKKSTYRGKACKVWSHKILKLKIIFEYFISPKGNFIACNFHKHLHIRSYLTFSRILHEILRKKSLTNRKILNRSKFIKLVQLHKTTNLARKTLIQVQNSP